MKYFFNLLFLPLLFTDQKQDRPLCKNAEYVLEQSRAYHDPKGEWESAILDLEIREPRVQVSNRFSNVDLNNSTGEFRLERSRGERISTHRVDAAGNASTLLDNQVETDPVKVKEFFLQPERNANYRKYYQFFYGLPMNLTSDYATLKTVGEEKLNGQKFISMDFELKEAMIAKTWRIFFSPEDYHVAGVQTLDEEAGEYLIFNGEAQLGSMKMPRFRHWYNNQEHSYLGSDILINGKLMNKSGN